MIKNFFAMSALFIVSTTCIAQTQNNIPLIGLIENAVSNARSFNAINVDQTSINKQSPSLAEAIEFAANRSIEKSSSGISPQSATSSCVTNMWVSNSGPYSSNRNCTTDYFNRAQMDNIIYPQFDLSLVARLPNVDVVRDGNTVVHLVFYSSLGMMSEYLVFANLIP